MSEELFGDKIFIPHRKFQVGDELWDIGTMIVESEVDGRLLEYAAALAPSREYGISLFAKRLSSNGNIEYFETCKEEPNGAMYRVGKIKGDLEDALIEHAQGHRVYFQAAPWRGQIENTDEDQERRYSHSITIDDKTWLIGAECIDDEKNQWIAMATPPLGEGNEILLHVSDGLSDEGEVAFTTYLADEETGEAREIKETDNIPPRLLNELDWFAKRYEFYGSVGEHRNVLLDELAEAATTGLNMDLELAQVMRDYYEPRVEEALQTGNKEAFKSHVLALNGAKEAIEALSKPPRHPVRQTFEERIRKTTDAALDSLER